MRPRAHYGIDGYPYLIGFTVGGLGALSISLLLGSRLGMAIAGLGAVALVPAALGAHYVARGKFRHRDRVLDHVDWRGDEHVLDVGTGGGLLAIGAAKRAPRGRSVGIDIWDHGDLSGNTRERMQRNARIEGVAERVGVHDDDARALSFADRTFDVVVSMLCLHNIEDEAGRTAALREIVRVLKPGGTVVISDLGGLDAYAATLHDLGLSVAVGPMVWSTFPPQRVLVGRRANG